MSKDNIILKAEGVSKQYRLGLVGTGTLSDDLKRWWYLIRGKEDPFLKIGESNDRSKKGGSNYVWALQDINFEVQRGEVLGIIGKNGAGKSTLLKILSKVTLPTIGEIKTKGRIASLLEVGTGFHPEMTGRENIYLNGAILGMTKAEIKSKEAEIIAFSGCEGYIDTPVKRYSSGMRVRLAFAVAAHLEPDILVVDEVLAVGDAEFQKKAIGKMQDISKGDGRTVLFVSHNMAAIQDLCTRAILLSNGEVKFDGKVDEVVNKYLSSNSVTKSKINFNTENNIDSVKIKSISIFNSKNKNTSQLKSGEKFTFEIELDVKRTVRNPIFSLRLSDLQNVNIVTWRSNDFVVSPLDNNIYKDFTIKLSVGSLYLLNGIYDISMGFADGKEVLDMKIKQAQIEVLADKPNLKYHIITKEKSSNSLIFSNADWIINQ
ncbi:ABC transporter ATP-binding protein [Mesoflavibacter sp. CH_XMU1422-2]|uniref:ABC transporter ATP-binding protein n=1 Tax=Mesoflavibacter sp. CH_XMU1422-2 TaxID=3107770 RepID=UPI00300AB448